MADIRNKEQFMSGRWNWTSLGYEAGFPRNIQFTDIDATVEIGGRFLFVECKWWNGSGRVPELPNGQRVYLKRLAMNPLHTVIVVYGEAQHNMVWAVRRFHHDAPMDWWEFRESPDIGGPAVLRSLFSEFAATADASQPSPTVIR